MAAKGRLDMALDYVPTCNRLLDIGCDYGDFTVRYLEKARQVYAVDPNRKVISEATARHPQVKFQVAPAEKLPFRDSFFDVVVLTDVLEHVKNEARTIREIYRVLGPQGTLILSVPHKGLFAFIDAFNMKFYFPHLYRWFKGRRFDPKIYQAAPWHRHYSLRQLEKLLIPKFRLEKVHRGGLFVWPTLWLIDASLYWKLWREPPRLLRTIHNSISDLDYSFDYGPAAYHILLVARSLKK